MSYEFPDTVKTFGEAVRHLRIEKKLSLRALAKRIKVSAPFLSDLERGRRHTDKIDQLATELGVDPEDLMRFDTRIHPDVKEWIDENPGVAALLKEMKASGRSVVELREALSRKKDTEH